MEVLQPLPSLPSLPSSLKTFVTPSITTKTFVPPPAPMTSDPDQPLSKERHRSRSFRLNLAALIEEIRDIIDSPEVPATGLCKNKVLSFGVKYIVLQDIINSIPKEDVVLNTVNTTALDQDARCFIAFDSSLEIYYTSKNIAQIFTEPQSYVMKSNLNRYLSSSASATLMQKCSANRDKISLMLDLKRATRSKKIYLRCKKYCLKTRNVWIGSCEMCSVSISKMTKYTDNFFLDTHWSLYDLLLDSDQSMKLDQKCKRLDAIKLIGLLNGYFTVDLNLSDRGILCKGVTIYSDDNFPVYFCGSIFSFNKYDSNNTLSLQQSLAKQISNPYPLGYSIDKHQRYMEFTKIFCNYVRLKRGNSRQIEQYLNLLLDPQNVNKLLHEGNNLEDTLVLEFLEHCFEELYEIHKTDLALWRRLQGAIGYTVGDLIITNVTSMQQEEHIVVS